MTTERTSDGLLRAIVVVLAALVLLPAVLMAFAVPMMGSMGPMGWRGGFDGGMAGGFTPWWALGAMAVWFLVLVGVGYVLYRGLVGGGESATGDQALEELRVAYARGDLSDEEYERRRETLEREE